MHRQGAKTRHAAPQQYAEGDDGAVTGWTLERNGDEKEYRRLHWSQNFLLLEFPSKKAARALNAIKYFFSTYCKGEDSAF
jgi:hypothetical protein